LGSDFAFGLGLASFLGAFAGSLVLDVADRQPQQLDHRVVAGEVWPRFLMILLSW